MKMYSLEAIDSLIDTYINEFGGAIVQLEEGVLGYGKVLLTGAEGKTDIIIQERFLNAWNSGHTVRQYHKLPLKYQNLVDSS